MKPLFTLTLSCRDRDGTPQPIGQLSFDYPGSATIILDRDVMGNVKMPEAPEFKANEGFLDMIDQATKDLAELHRQMVEGQISAERVRTDMFEVHRWLTG